MAGITPTPVIPLETTSFLSGAKNGAYLGSAVTPLLMEYNQTAWNEMMTNYSDCFEFSNNTNFDNIPEDANSTILVSIQPLNNSNCSLFNGNATYIENTINNTSQCNPNQEYFSWSYALVGTLFQSIILVVGVLGNVLTCTVVQRTRSMHTTTNCYLVSLSVADTITLVSTVPQEILSYHIIGNLWVWGHFTCKIYVFLNNLGINASALSLTAFTIERYIAICHPIRAKSICRVSRANKIIIGCWIFAIIYCTPWFFIATTKTFCVDGIEGEMLTCSFSIARTSKTYSVIFMLDIVMYYVFPLVLSVVLYILIGRVLLIKAKNSFPGGVSRATIRQDPATAKTQSNRVQVVKMLACVVMIFATLWLPYRGMLVYNSFVKKPFFDLWYLMFAKTCIYINCAINPILYNAMSDRFRKAFRSLLICRDGSTRSEQRLCMAGYTTANHFEKSSYEGNVNTRIARHEGPSNAVSNTWVNPSTNAQIEVKRHHVTPDSSQCLRKAAAEAAAKNNMASESILARANYSSYNTIVNQNSIPKEQKERKIHNENEKITSKISFGTDFLREIDKNSQEKMIDPTHQKNSRRHHHHHHHHHSRYQGLFHQDENNISDKCTKCNKRVRNTHCSNTAASNKLCKKDPLNDPAGVRRLDSSCSLKVSTTKNNCKHCCTKKKTFRNSTKLSKTMSAPSSLSTLHSSSVKCYDASSTKNYSALNPNLEISNSAKEEEEDEGEEHQILVKLNARTDRALCHVFDTQTNYLCRDIAITDTKVPSPSNKNINHDDVMSQEEEKGVLTCYHKIGNHVKKKHDKSAASSSVLPASNSQTQPIEIKKGLHKRQLSHYLTEITFSTAL